MAELDNVETIVPREDGPAFWTEQQAAELRWMIANIWSDAPVLIVHFRDDLWAIFEACFEVGIDDGSDWTDAEYAAVYAGFGQELNAGQLAYRATNAN